MIVERFPHLKSTKSVFLTALILGLIIGLSFNSGDNTRETGNRTQSLNDIPESGNYVSKAKYNGLKQEYDALKENYNSLSETLDGTNITLTDYQSLNDRYSSLYYKYQRLKQQKEPDGYSLDPPYVKAQNRSYIIRYYTLNGEVDGYNVDSGVFESQIFIGQLMRSYSKEELEQLGFTEIADYFEGQDKYVELEGQGKYYELNPFMIPQNFETVSNNIYNRYDSDRKRVRAVWNFVTQLNTYSRELEETPRMPMETLLAGGGDCEDTAILAASILEAMPADWDVQLVYMDLDNPENAENINHVSVYVDTGEYATFVDTTSNSQMSPYTQVDGYYVDVDPPQRS